MTPPPRPANVDRLYLIDAEVKRVERSVRVLRQMVAREISEATHTSDSQEAHANDDEARRSNT